MRSTSARWTAPTLRRCAGPLAAANNATWLVELLQKSIPHVAATAEAKGSADAD